MSGMLIVNIGSCWLWGGALVEEALSARWNCLEAVCS